MRKCQKQQEKKYNNNEKKKAGYETCEVLQVGH